jgi:pilus assembly protein CpaB
MPRQRIILIAGIILGLIAIFMINMYIDQQKRAEQENAKRALARAQENQAAVLVANQEIPRGAAITPEMLETKIIPNQFVQPQAVTSLDRIGGMITVAPIAKGEQISLTKLNYPRQGAGGLAEATPIGKRAITVSVDNLSLLGGMIKPGDYVDMIAMIPVPVQTPDGKQTTQVVALPLLQNVLVLAIGQRMGTGTAESSGGRYQQAEGGAGGSSLVTFAVSPQEASIIAFIQEQTKIRLILRSPADSKIEPVPPVSWDTLLQYVMPKKEETTQTIKKEEPQAEGYVEIYRGLNKEKVPLYK